MHASPFVCVSVCVCMNNLEYQVPGELSHPLPSADPRSVLGGQGPTRGDPDPAVAKRHLRWIGHTIICLTTACPAKSSTANYPMVSEQLAEQRGTTRTLRKISWSSRPSNPGTDWHGRPLVPEQSSDCTTPASSVGLRSVPNETKGRSAFPQRLGSPGPSADGWTAHASAWTATSSGTSGSAVESPVQPLGASVVVGSTDN